MYFVFFYLYCQYNVNKVAWAKIGDSEPLLTGLYATYTHSHDSVQSQFINLKLAIHLKKIVTCFLSLRSTSIKFASLVGIDYWLVNIFIVAL